MLNLDFEEEKLKEYNINNNTYLVSLNKKINSLNFKCNIINNYEITYTKELKEMKDFDTNVLYESTIYRRDNFNNINKDLINDEVKLIKLT